MIDLTSKIDFWSDTKIRDKKAIEFINNIKSLKLRSIVRNHFETQCSLYDQWYSLEDFKNNFKSYLGGKNNNYYFLSGLNDHYEDILKKLLGIEKWNNQKENERRTIR